MCYPGCLYGKMLYKASVMQALWIAYGSVALLLAVPCDAFIGAGLAQTQGFNPRAASPVILQAGGKFNKDPNAASRIAELLASFQKKQRQYSEHPNKFMEDAMDAIKRHDPTMALESFDRAMAVDNEVSKYLWGRGRKYCGCDVVIVVRGVVVVMVMWSYNLIEDFLLSAHHTRVSCHVSHHHQSRFCPYCRRWSGIVAQCCITLDVTKRP